MKQYQHSNAAIIAPLSAPLFMFVVLMVTGNPIISSVFTALFIVPISYFGFALFIMPLHRYLKAKNIENVLALAASGLFGGVVIVFVLYIILAVALGSRERFELTAVVTGALFGGGVGIVFCLLSGTKRLLPSNGGVKINK